LVAVSYDKRQKASRQHPIGSTRRYGGVAKHRIRTGARVIMTVEGYVDDCSREAVTGWAIDWESPAAEQEILVVVDGREVGRCKTGIERPGLKRALGGLATGFHEFRFDFSPPLKRRDHHTIEVFAASGRFLLPNGRRILFAEDKQSTLFSPILVTSSGRSGSTLIMQEFARHPEIVISNVYPFEIKLTSYYAALWNVVTSTCYLPGEAEIDFASHATKDFLIGRNPWNRPDLLTATGGPGMLRLMGKTFPNNVKNLLRATVEEYYGIIADSVHSGARMFAEKSPINEPVRQACRVLFDEVKEIVLVRDPRDYFCSASSFWQTSEEKIIETMQLELPELMKIFLRSDKDVLFVRYEDLILDGPNTQCRIYDFLGCEANFTPNSLQADRVPDRHVTSRSATASVGRFRDDLDAATIRRCEDTFRPFMEMFDYR
jgi:hypothetical protein